MASDDGIGQKSIVRFFKDVPGFNDPAIQKAIANLKTSGHYARIIAEAQAETEQERALAIAQAEREQADAEEAERQAIVDAKAQADADTKARAMEAKAAAKAAKKRSKVLRDATESIDQAVITSASKPITFDFDGVSKHLKNSEQVEAFREQGAAKPGS